jgi:hypothetical protein
MEAAITKQGVRNLNGLGPQRKRPLDDDKPRKQEPATAPVARGEQMTAAPAPAPDKT